MCPLWRRNVTVCARLVTLRILGVWTLPYMYITLLMCTTGFQELCNASTFSSTKGLVPRLTCYHRASLWWSSEMRGHPFNQGTHHCLCSQPPCRTEMLPVCCPDLVYPAPQLSKHSQTLAVYTLVMDTQRVGSVSINFGGVVIIDQECFQA